MGGGATALQKDVPWRATYSPILRIPHSDYALTIMKHPDPIGCRLGTEAIVEAAGPDCIVPGQNPPIKLLGFKRVSRKQPLYLSR
ncbi:hypothetical protein RND71_035922 [Anisodus tanguticus]|uniref:Uncharacterized protein n=1 Tax=Anisodus tanguticus TaxID=243964 RepID=A0AAE1V063_9SOLA|nr:hypothetical protein RND71_035922 [Anisodus tanguticus]